MAKTPTPKPRTKPRMKTYGRIEALPYSPTGARPFNEEARKVIRRARFLRKGYGISVGPAANASRASNFAACLNALTRGRHFSSTIHSDLAWVKRIR